MSSGYKILYSDTAKKQLKKLDRQVSKRILEWLEVRIYNSTDPKLWGAPLLGHFSGLWKYRIGSYRLICEIRDCELVVHVIEIGHRKEIYE